MAEELFIPEGLSWQKRLQHPINTEEDQPTTEDELFIPEGLSWQKRLDDESQLLTQAKQREEAKETGFWAHIKKSFADAYDYINISKAGVGDADEEELARRVADVTRRQDEVAKSASHQYIMDIFRDEGKDVTEAKGWADTSFAILDGAVKVLAGVATHPMGALEFGASQAGNMAVTIGSMFAGMASGAALGSAVPGIGTALGGIAGSRVGALAGGTAVETGAAYIEALHKDGIDTSDQNAVFKAISNPEFQAEMYRKGLTKGITIGAVDAVFLGFSKLPHTKAGRVLRNDLLKKEGLDIRKEADWATVMRRGLEGDKAINNAFEKYASIRVKAPVTKAFTIETIGEGLGEGLGGLAAFGETSFEDIGLEMLGSGVQSAVQQSVAGSLGMARERMKESTREAARQQARSVKDGVDSELNPAQINADLMRRRDMIGEEMEGVDAELAQWEQVVANSSPNATTDLLSDLLTVTGLDQYRITLQSALGKYYDQGFVPIFVALNREEQAALAEGGTIDRPVVGSLDHNNVKAKPLRKNKKGEVISGEEVVLIKAPIESIVMRGNWENSELLTTNEGLQIVAAPAPEEVLETEVEVEEEAVTLTEAEIEARDLEIAERDVVLGREIEAGELDTQALERSERDVKADEKAAATKAENKLNQLRDVEEYDKVDDLQAAVDRTPIEVKPKQRRKWIPLKGLLNDYRKALANPNSKEFVNRVLEPTGYKLSVKKDGVHIVPISGKKDDQLRVPNTGNRTVAQSTVDDYLFWVRDEQIKAVKEKEALEGKPPAPRKSPLKGRTIITPQSVGALTSLQNVFKRKGKFQFVDRVRKLLSTKTGKDAILEQIAKVYRQKIHLSPVNTSVMTLAGKSDQADIAKAYALANMLITLRDSVSSILPDNTLSIDDKNTKLLARLKLKSPISGVRENQLISQIKETFGEDATYTRISDFEVVIGSDLKPIQIARRFGRLKGKRNDISSSGLFTAQTETHTHNWAEDPSGESIREQIRSLGFGDILAWADDRRADYLSIAEEVGATEVDQYRAEPRAPPEEAATEEAAPTPIVMPSRRVGGARIPTAPVTPTDEAEGVLFALGPAEAKQQYASTGTSLNQAAAVLKKKSLFEKGTRNLDLGGGKFNKGVNQLKTFGVDSRVLDDVPNERGETNRSPEHNKAVIEWVNEEAVDTVTIANVLNVIKEQTARIKTLQRAFEAVKSGGKVYIQIYEGSRSSKGRFVVNKDGTRDWQNNKPLKAYLSDVRRVFSDAQIVNVEGTSIIVATKRHKENEIKRLGLPGVDSVHGVGKRMGSDYYVHKSAEDAAIKEVGTPAFNRAKAKLPDDFVYDLIHIDKSKGLIEFIQSPDWDTASEPTRGRAFQVIGKTTKIKEQDSDPSIYHHKWSMVRADYEGFDVIDSANRSVSVGEAYEQLRDEYPKIASKVGRRNFWESVVVPVISASTLKVGAKPTARATWHNLKGRYDTQKRVRRTNKKVFELLDAEFERVYGEVLDPINNEEHFKLAANILASEVRYQLQQAESGFGWYEQDIKEAFDITSRIIPKLKDPVNALLMTGVTGIHSNGQKVKANWKSAATAMYEYFRTGVIPFVSQNNEVIGVRGHTIVRQVQMLENMLKKMGPTDTVTWLMDDHTVAEIMEVRETFGGFKHSSNYLKGGKDANYTGTFIFGPKIGAFIKNLNGVNDEHAITVDIWAARTYNRVIGRSRDNMGAPRGEPEREVIKRLFKEAGDRVGVDPANAQALLWFFEQQLHNTLGTSAVPQGNKDGAEAFVKDYDDGKVIKRSKSAIRESNANAFRTALTKKSKEADETEELTESEQEALFALFYHGTGREWEGGSPSLQFIGSGEGAQAFGWGIYFAQSKGVAEVYRAAMARRAKSGTGSRYTFDEVKTAILALRGEPFYARDRGQVTQGVVNEIIDGIQSDPALVSRILSGDADSARFSSRMTWDVLDHFGGAFLYTLDVDNAIVEQMLDWDALLSDQSQSIQEASETILTLFDEALSFEEGMTGNVYELDTLTGADLIRLLTRYASEGPLPGDETIETDPAREASEFLARWGIPGVKYFEGGRARREQQGNRNFVVWDQNILDQMNVVGLEGAKEDSPSEKTLALQRGATAGLSVSKVRDVLSKKFGKRGIESLEKRGILNIVETAADLPVGLIRSADEAGRVRGLYDPKTESAYIVANRVTEQNAVKILLHEVGTHFGLVRTIGSKAYADIVTELWDGRETTFKPWFDRVSRVYGGRNLSDEILAEEVLAAIAEDTSDITLSLRTRIYNAIRKFLQDIFGVPFAAKLTEKEIGHIIQGALRHTMRSGIRRDTSHFFEREVPQTYFPDTRPSYATIVFPDNPTRRLTDAHRRYDIISAIGNVFSKAEERRLRSNMDGMMKVAEQVAKRGYKNVDVHFPVVVTGGSITSRYAMFKNTKTGTELVIRMSDHPKDMNAAASAFPFLSFNNGHKIDKVDLSDIDKAVKLLSEGKLEGMNGLQFQFEYGLGEGVRQISKSNMQKFSYSDFLRALGRKSRTKLQTIQDLATVELTSAAIVGEEGALFSLAPDGTEGDQQAVIRRTMGGQNRRSMSEWINDARHLWMEKRVQNIVDAYRPVRNRLGDDGTRAWQMMHLSENTHGMLHSVLHFGRPKEVYRNGEFDWYESDLEGEGLVEVLRDLGGEADRFMAWMTYVRANRLSKEDREKNFTEDEIKIGLGLNKETVGKNDKGKMADGRDRKLVYAQAMQKMSKFQRSILDLAVNAGVISKQMSEELETDFYVPFYREFTKDEKTYARGPTPVHDFVNIKDVIRKLRGSELDTNDVLHNVMMNWTALMGAAMKNRAGVTAMEAAEKSGAATKLTDKKLTAQLSFAKGKTKGAKFDNFVYVLVDGERVWYEVHDPLVLNSMVHLAWGGIDSKAMRVLSTFKRWLTLGVTASPAFKIRNLIRDSVHAIAVGKMSYNFFGNTSSGLDVLKKNNVISNQMMMGGATFHFGFYNDDPASIRRMINAGISESRILNTSTKIKGFLENFWKPYADVGNRMENANRAALYMQRKEEVGHLEASFEARDLLNFSSHGRGVAVQWLTSASPFLNARLQGLDKLIRSGQKGSRARLLAVVGTVTLASILLRMSYEGDEDYEELEEWQKNTYWPLKIPGTNDFFFLPKPFEIGAIATVGERITENFVRRMHEDANQFGYAPGKKLHKPENFLWVSRYTWSRIGEIISDQLAMDWRPQIARPFMEVMKNKNAFTDRQIENIMWDIHNLPNELRVRPYTSYLARNASWAMGEMLDIFGQKDQEIHLSPVQIDHLIKGYFGWLGATITGSFDLLGSPEVEPSKRLDEMRGWLPAGSFIAQDPRRNSKYITLFYEQMKEINKYKSSYDAYKREFRYEEAAKVVADNKDVFAWLRTYDDALDYFSTINKRIGVIYDSTDMTPKKKREEIDKLNEQKVDIAKKLVISRAEYEEEKGTIPHTAVGALRAAK